MHRLKIYSGHGDLLELNLKTPARPTIRIGEIYIDGKMEPWNSEWENILVKDFEDDYETVQKKIIQFYKDEKKSCRVPSKDSTEVLQRVPGEAEIYSEFEGCTETWTLLNCRIIGCDFLDGDEKVVLELAYDGARYDQESK